MIGLCNSQFDHLILYNHNIILYFIILFYKSLYCYIIHNMIVKNINYFESLILVSELRHLFVILPFYINLHPKYYYVL